MPSPPAKPFKVVAAIDLSEASRPVLRRALSIANLSHESEVHAVTVSDYDRLGALAKGGQGSPSDALLALVQEVVAEWTARAQAAPGNHVGRVITHALVGSPASELVWLAAYVDADLLVVGTHGRTGVSRLMLGSVAERVLRSAGCPVLVERPRHHDRKWTVPEIEAPCADCLAARQASGGARLWCDRHSAHHPHAHVYSYAGASIGGARPWGFEQD